MSIETETPELTIDTWPAKLISSQRAAFLDPEIRQVWQRGAERLTDKIHTVMEREIKITKRLNAIARTLEDWDLRGRHLDTLDQWLDPLSIAGANHDQERMLHYLARFPQIEDDIILWQCEQTTAVDSLLYHIPPRLEALATATGEMYLAAREALAFRLQQHPPTPGEIATHTGEKSLTQLARRHQQLAFWRSDPAAGNFNLSHFRHQLDEADAVYVADCGMMDGADCLWPLPEVRPCWVCPDCRLWQQPDRAGRRQNCAICLQDCQLAMEDDDPETKRQSWLKPREIAVGWRVQLRPIAPNCAPHLTPRSTPELAQLRIQTQTSGRQSRLPAPAAPDAGSHVP